ncbi:MAG: pyridoxine 5'-phosphate synthase [Candidatus Lightella neohaematopini]|nr:pyridoxine 5'-phosphate synthase [Candidatus Lightella neohaematopini]MCV2529000.1 pyridoxine 5'-phosphate synthase [Candidatus Lightella neohaematopini]
MADTFLNVNIDHIATVRNLRNTIFPDPVQAAFIAEQSGANGITVHLREDHRHINERDIKILRQTVQTNLNLEISANEIMVNLACLLKPDYCCLVPEHHMKIITKHGLDLIKEYKKIDKLINILHNNDIKVSLFIDPLIEQIETAAKLNTDYIKLNTGAYTILSKQHNDKFYIELDNIKQAVLFATSLGLLIHAGHGLNYYNIAPIVKLNQIKVLHIGHSIISYAMIYGLKYAIKHMLQIIRIL